MPKRNKYQTNIYEATAVSIIGQSINNFINSQDLSNNPRGDLLFHTFLITLPMMRRFYTDSIRAPYLKSSEEMLRLAILPFLYDLCCYGFDSIGRNLLIISTFSSASYLISNLALQISTWYSKRITPKVNTTHNVLAVITEHPEDIVISTAAITATAVTPALPTIAEALPLQTASAPIPKAESPRAILPAVASPCPAGSVRLGSTSLAIQEFNPDDEWVVVPERIKLTAAELQKHQLMSLMKEYGGTLPDGVTLYIKGRSIEAEI